MCLYPRIPSRLPPPHSRSITSPRIVRAPALEWGECTPPPAHCRSWQRTHPAQAGSGAGADLTAPVRFQAMHGPRTEGSWGQSAGRAINPCPQGIAAPLPFPRPVGEAPSALSSLRGAPSPSPSSTLPQACGQGGGHMHSSPTTPPRPTSPDTAAAAAHPVQSGRTATLQGQSGDSKGRPRQSATRQTEGGRDK